MIAISTLCERRHGGQVGPLTPSTGSTYARRLKLRSSVASAAAVAARRILSSSLSHLGCVRAYSCMVAQESSVRANNSPRCLCADVCGNWAAYRATTVLKLSIRESSAWKSVWKATEPARLSQHCVCKVEGGTDRYTPGFHRSARWYACSKRMAVLQRRASSD